MAYRAVSAVGVLSKPLSKSSIKSIKKKKFCLIIFCSSKLCTHTFTEAASGWPHEKVLCDLVYLYLYTPNYMVHQWRCVRSLYMLLFATPFLYPQISMGVFSVLRSRPCHAKKYELMTTKKNGNWITHVPGSLARAIVSMGGVVYICRSVPVKPVSSTSSDVRGQRVHRYFRNQKVSFVYRFPSRTSPVMRFRQHSSSPIEHLCFRSDNQSLVRSHIYHDLMFTIVHSNIYHSVLSYS